MSHRRVAVRSPPCSMEVDGEHVTRLLHRILCHPPEVVWRAITEPDQFREWSLTTAVAGGGPGAKVDLVTGPSRVHATGRILAWDPHRVYEHEWNVVREGSPFRSGEQSVGRWDLSPREGGTLIVLTRRGLTRATAEAFQHGLPGLLDRLGAQLDGTLLPEWMRPVSESRRRSREVRIPSPRIECAPRGSKEPVHRHPSRIGSRNCSGT